jgi:hypothetical protein
MPPKSSGAKKAPRISKKPRNVCSAFDNNLELEDNCHPKARKLHSGDIYSNFMITTAIDATDTVEKIEISTTDLNFNCPEHIIHNRKKNYCLTKTIPCPAAIIMQKHNITWSKQYQTIQNDYVQQGIPSNQILNWCLTYITEEAPKDHSVLNFNSYIIRMYEEWKECQNLAKSVVSVPSTQSNNILLLVHQDCWLSCGTMIYSFFNTLHMRFDCPKFNVRVYVVPDWNNLQKFYKDSSDKSFFNDVLMIFLISHGTSNGIAHDDIKQPLKRSTIYNVNDICYMLHMWCPQVRLIYFGVCQTGAILYTKQKDYEKFLKSDKHKLPGSKVSAKRIPVYLIGYRANIEHIRIIWDITVIMDIFLKENRSFASIEQALTHATDVGISQEICYQTVSKADISTPFQNQ